MYLSMDSNTLTNEALRRPQGSLAYELADALNGELDELVTDNEKLDDKAGEAENKMFDLCGEAVWRIEQIEDVLQDILDDEKDHYETRNSIKDTMKLLNEAVIYFNGQQDI